MDVKHIYKMIKTAGIMMDMLFSPPPDHAIRLLTNLSSMDEICRRCPAG